MCYRSNGEWQVSRSNGLTYTCSIDKPPEKLGNIYYLSILYVYKKIDRITIEEIDSYPVIYIIYGFVRACDELIVWKLVVTCSGIQVMRKNRQFEPEVKLRLIR